MIQRPPHRERRQAEGHQNDQCPVGLSGRSLSQFSGDFRNGRPSLLIHLKPCRIRVLGLGLPGRLLGPDGFSLEFGRDAGAGEGQEAVRPDGARCRLAAFDHGLGFRVCAVREVEPCCTLRRGPIAAPGLSSAIAASPRCRPGAARTRRWSSSRPNCMASPGRCEVSGVLGFIQSQPSPSP